MKKVKVINLGKGGAKVVDLAEILKDSEKAQENDRRTDLLMEAVLEDLSGEISESLSEDLAEGIAEVIAKAIIKDIKEEVLSEDDSEEEEDDTEDNLEAGSGFFKVFDEVSYDNGLEKLLAATKAAQDYDIRLSKEDGERLAAVLSVSAATIQHLMMDFALNGKVLDKEKAKSVEGLIEFFKASDGIYGKHLEEMRRSCFE